MSYINNKINLLGENSYIAGCLSVISPLKLKNIKIATPMSKKINGNIIDGLA
jgi:hypothetical protein